MSTASLLQQNLTEVGLIRILAREDIAPKLFRELPVEEAALMIQRGMHSAGAGRVKYKRVHRAKKSSPNKAAKKSGNKAPPPPNYWRLVKNEVRILVCTDNKKYAGLRKQIQKKGSATQTMLVSNIASAIALKLGYTAAVIVPFVAMTLLAMIQISTNAWCAGQT